MIINYHCDNHHHECDYDLSWWSSPWVWNDLSWWWWWSSSMCLGRVTGTSRFPFFLSIIIVNMIIMIIIITIVWLWFVMIIFIVTWIAINVLTTHLWCLCRLGRGRSLVMAQLSDNGKTLNRQSKKLNSKPCTYVTSIFSLFWFHFGNIWLEVMSTSK